jgi:hypothetical protein
VLALPTLSACPAENALRDTEGGSVLCQTPGTELVNPMKYASKGVVSKKKNL